MNKKRFQKTKATEAYGNLIYLSNTNLIHRGLNKTWLNSIYDKAEEYFSKIPDYMLKNKNVRRNINRAFSKLEDAKWHTDNSTAESRYRKTVSSHVKYVVKRLKSDYKTKE